MCWRTDGKALKSKGKCEGKLKKGEGQRRPKQPETCVWCGKRRSLKGRRSSQKSDMLVLRKLGPTAHEVSDEPAPEAVMAEAWCVANDGNCDCIRRSAGVVDMELYQELSTSEQR